MDLHNLAQANSKAPIEPTEPITVIKGPTIQAFWIIGAGVVAVAALRRKGKKLPKVFRLFAWMIILGAMAVVVMILLGIVIGFINREY